MLSLDGKVKNKGQLYKEGIKMKLSGKMVDDGKAVYGTIPYFGNEWVVRFKPYGSVTSISHTGYGNFPRNRFPKIPVYQFKNVPFSKWDSLQKFLQGLLSK